MLYSIISIDDIFYNEGSLATNSILPRSSNPYDYIRRGYYIENASLFGGENNVDFKSNISSYSTSSNIRTAGV